MPTGPPRRPSSSCASRFWSTQPGWAPRWQAIHGTQTATLLTRALDDLEPYFTRYLPQLVLASTVTPATVLVLLTQDWSAAVAVVCTLPSFRSS